MRGEASQIPSRRARRDRNGAMSTPPAGWYPDPAMEQTQRYWDGTQWTHHIAPITAAPVPSDHGPATAEHWLVPVGRSWQSIVAGYMGFMALVAAVFGYAGVVFGLLTVGMGAWALSVARAGGHGRGRAIFGIVCGLIAMAVGVWAENFLD